METNQVLSANEHLLEILIRLSVELGVLLILVSVIYRKFSGKKEHMFSFFLMGIIIFLLCSLLQRVEIQMGMVLGLFAIFSIIRFRTTNFSTKDMSYLFTILGLSAINAMFDFPHPVRGTILFNSIVIATVLGLELALKNYQSAEPEKEKKKNKNKKKDKGAGENWYPVIYDNLKLLDSKRNSELIKDIASRTGLEIDEVRITRIDLAGGIAELKVHCRKPAP
jgi:hypothetical protein